MHTPKKAAKKKTASTALEPEKIVECRFGPMSQGHGASVVVAPGNGLRRYDAGGTELGRIDVAAAVDNLKSHGDFVVGWHRHGTTPFLLADSAAEKAVAWKPPVDMVLPRVSLAGPGAFLVHDGDRLFVVDDGRASEVPLRLSAGQHLGRVRSWNSKLLLELCGPQGAEPYFQTACVGVDGVERWRRPGRAPTPWFELALLADDEGVAAIDDAGAVVGRVAEWRPGSGAEGDSAFICSGGDVYLSSDTRVLRWNPREGVRWSTSLPAPSSLEPPVVAAGVIAVATSRYSSIKTVWFLEEEGGKLVHSAAAAGAVTGLCPVAGVDAVVACSYTKKLFAWRNLLTEPERLALNHPDKVFDLLSPGRNVVVAHTGDALVFWDLAAPKEGPA